MRPLATILDDIIVYGFNDNGAGVHDIIRSRCNLYMHNLMMGKDVNTCCHSNLVHAAVSDGLEESDVKYVRSIQSSLLRNQQCVNDFLAIVF